MRQAGRSGFADIITFDMGGTSTDVCLVGNGTPSLRAETEVDGLPIRTPVLDIVSVGAGGGSIVWVDDGGLLRVGPRSAGADPGPACYGRGGQDATVTDAHLIRGTIRPDAFLGGRMTVDVEASRRAFAGLADRFGVGLGEIADSAVRVADANIVRAIQFVSTERGRDPRDYVLVPFGGAGPLHAARVAEDLGIQAICVPPNAGVLSAYGLLAADYVQYETWTRRVPIDAAAPGVVRATFAEMEAALRRTFERLDVRRRPAPSALGRHAVRRAGVRGPGRARGRRAVRAHRGGPPRALPGGAPAGVRVRRERTRPRGDRRVPRRRRRAVVHATSARRARRRAARPTAP